MNKSITIVYVTSRREPLLRWFLDSFQNQYGLGKIDLIVVDGWKPREKQFLVDTGCFSTVKIVNPKPTIWQGEHRITKEDWWAKSNALNTGICLCQTEWIAFVDDRCVLSPAWLSSVNQAMREPYAVCGSYEKRYNMQVENGVITDPGVTAGIDTRRKHNAAVPFNDWYGGSCALPLEWCLKVNGWSEDVCEGLGSEDSMFGRTLINSGIPVRYDDRMLIIEDRTPLEIDGALKRADKGVSPNDKSHRIVEIFRDKTSSQNSYDIRNMRDRVLGGEPFPPPSASHFDWFDGQPISEMT